MAIARKQIRWNGWAEHRDALGESEAVWRWLAGELSMPALLATPARPLEDIALPAQKLTRAQIADFVVLLGAERVMEDDYERAFHARGRSYPDLIALRGGDLSTAPDAVLYPHTADEILAILQLAAREKIPVIPFGGGTGQSGGVSAGPGSITVDVSGMDQVLEIDVAAQTALADAGITAEALENALAAKGMALDTKLENAAFSSLGGWIASSRGGDWLAGLQLVTPLGLLDTEVPAAGPDLRQILQGSQGIFGIVTRARIKIRPVTESLEQAFLFADFSSAVAAMREAARSGFSPASWHLSDEAETRFQRRLAALQRPRGLLRRLKEALIAQPDTSGAFLIAVFPDKPSLRAFGNLAKKQGGSALGETAAKQGQINQSQRLYQRDVMLDRGLGVDSLETWVGWSALGALHASVRTALDKAMRDNSLYPGAHGLVLSHIHHADAAGATLCFTFLFPRQLESEMAQVQAIRRAGIVAIQSNGCGTRPHYGVDEMSGAEKTSLGIAALRGVKAALDPAGIINPGKLIPPA